MGGGTQKRILIRTKNTWEGKWETSNSILFWAMKAEAAKETGTLLTKPFNKEETNWSNSLGSDEIKKSCFKCLNKYVRNHIENKWASRKDLMTDSNHPSSSKVRGTHLSENLPLTYPEKNHSLTRPCYLLNCRSTALWNAPITQKLKSQSRLAETTSELPICLGHNKLSMRKPHQRKGSMEEFSSGSRPSSFTKEMEEPVTVWEETSRRSSTKAP